MLRSPKSSFFLLLVNAALFIGCLSATPGQAFGQTPKTQPVAYRVTADSKGLNHASAPAPAVIATSLELQTFELVNVERARQGLRPLVWDAELTHMARLHSENMARQNFFNHQAPDGQGLRERSRASGISGFKRLAENLAYNKGFADAASCAVVGWMHSEGHRDHILDGEFTRSGIGIARSADGRVYFTQVFVVH
jgi:uncharacterized protein YkwD